MLTERSEIQFGQKRIPFEIRRSAKRATVALTVEANGNLVVTAPAKVSIDKLNTVVRHKAWWVIQRVRRAREMPVSPSEREFITGETVLYLGRQFRLKVFEKAEPSDPRIWAGWYEVPIAPGLSGEARRFDVRRRFAKSLAGHAALYLPDRLTRLCHEARIKPPSFLVRDQQKRWGSCDAKGTLRINWRIIQAPIALVDYVLAHEVVHLAHLRHGPEFWAALGQMMPDYERRRQRLREIGPALEW